MLSHGATLLFQGDSITDCGRSRTEIGPNKADALGRGYAFLAACELRRRFADRDLQILNRGISGNRVTDLRGRWDADCLDLKPALVSILIGVNDEWRRHDGKNNQIEVDEYTRVYRDLLTTTRHRLPDVTLVLCEPFVLRCGAVTDAWFPAFDERRAAVKKLAADFGATFVPFQSAFDEATKQAPPAAWAGDGVHPTLAGHALMARTWLDHATPAIG